MSFIGISSCQSQITRFMRPTWGPARSCRPQVDPTLAPWTLLSGLTWLSVPQLAWANNKVNIKPLYYWSCVRRNYQWQWITLTKGQWCTKCFHIMTSLFHFYIFVHKELRKCVLFHTFLMHETYLSWWIQSNVLYYMGIFLLKSDWHNAMI